MASTYLTAAWQRLGHCVLDLRASGSVFTWFRPMTAGIKGAVRCITELAHPLPLSPFAPSSLHVRLAGEWPKFFNQSELPDTVAVWMLARVVANV